MAEYSHVIMRQRLEIEIPDKKYEPEVKRRAHKILEEKLNEILESTFSTEVPEDVVISLDQLHINLAETDQNSLEEDISRKIRHKLPLILKEQVSLAIQDPLKRRITPLPEAKLKAIKHYLLNGYLAWWIPSNDEKIIENLYLDTYRETPATLKDLWTEISKEPLAIKRFLTQFSPLTIQKSIHLLSPAHADRILHIIEDFKNLQAVLSKIDKTPRYKKSYTNTKNIVLTQAIHTLSTTKEFKEAIFLENCLQKIAKELDTTYPALITALVRELPRKHPTTRRLKSNLVHYIVHSHEAQLSSKHIANKTTAQLSLLVRELDQLLAQEGTIDKSQLSKSINKIFQHVDNSTAKDILIGHLKSAQYARKLTHLLPTADFIKLIEIIQPNIQAGFRIIQQLWESTLPQPNENAKLVEQLTIKYLNKPFSKQQNVDKYINHLMQKLVLYETNFPERWVPLIEKSKPKLEKDHSPELVKLILTNLTTKHPSTKDTKTGTTLPTIAAILTKAIHKVQSDAILTTNPSLAKLVNTLYDKLSVVVDGKEHITPTLEKEIENDLKGLLKRTTSNTGQLNWTTAQLRAWLQQQVQSDMNNPANGLALIKKELGTTLSKLSLLSITQIKDFFTEQLLPAGHSDPSTCVVVIVKQIATVPAHKTEVLDLLQQKHVRKQFVKNTEPSIRTKLVEALLPLARDTKEIYQQILLRADVLRASTISDKQVVLDEIFLEIASKNLQQSTEDHFIQKSLLAISYEAQLPKAEVYRRVMLVAKKHAPHTTLLSKLQGLAVFFSINHEETAEQLDTSFLSIYHLIASFIPSPTLATELYGLLANFLKKVIHHRLEKIVIDQQVQQKVDELFKMLSTRQKQKLFEAIKKRLQELTVEYAQTLENTWMHFLQTGELQEGYSSPSKLFNTLLAIDEKALNSTNLSPASNTELKSNLAIPHLERLAQKFITAILVPSIRKRLVARLTTPDLQKVVLLVAKEKGKTLIKWIQRMQDIWEYAGTPSTNHQETKLVWWEAVLVSSAKTLRHHKSEKAWVANSLANFSETMAISRYTLLSTLVTATKNFESSDQRPTEIAELHQLGNLLRDIQQDWEKSNRKEAKKVWRTQPIFQELHQLFTIGLNHSEEHLTINLEKLEQQLGNLIKQEPPAVKKFFLDYANPAVTSQKITHYFSTPLIKQIITILAPKSSPFIQKYVDFVTSPQPAFYIEKGIDPFNWQKYIERATLTYLLQNQEKHQEIYFNKQKYLKDTLNLINAYTKQDTNPIIQALIDYHNKNQSPSPYTQLIQQLETILSKEIKKQSEQESNINQVVMGEQLKDNYPKIVPHKHEQEAATDQKDIKSHSNKDIKVYIRNSGLIFLWPFLEELLAKQGLLKKQKLKDKISRNNAVHTLQYLVTEDLLTSDWRMILNKLLCGMDYNEVTLIGYYLREEDKFAKTVIEEQEKTTAATEDDKNQSKEITPIVFPEEIIRLKKNTEEILNMVLEKWEDLKKLEKFEPFQHGFGIQELRQYILQRDGLLQYIEQEDNKGYWHLTITGEGYDTEIKKIPWPIDKIRLPFMKEDLLVLWLPN